jgi:hypothetical protein
VKGGETIKQMQSETGCKINVSQASGADIEREIGLVGTRQAIEDAKRAIWEKVDQVVSLFVSHIEPVLTLCSERRITAVDVTMAMVAPVPTGAMITTHSSHSLQLMLTVALHLHSLLRLLLIPQAVQLLTLMPSTVATRTISPCGMLHLRNNSNKEGHHPKPDPRLSRVRFDIALVPETLSIDACLHDRSWTFGARGMT